MCWVLSPYDEFFGHTDKTSTLLVNNTLRREYEELHIEINRSKDSFLAAMKKQSLSKKKELDKEIALTFMKSADDESFYRALERISTEIKEQTDAPFADVHYDKIFDDRILAALTVSDVQAAIQDYIIRYNQLLDASKYFQKGVFEYFNASQVATTLAKNGFFDAKHTVTLSGQEQTTIQTKDQLEAVIQSELDGITQDPTLKTTFSAIKTKLEKNAQLRDFQRYLGDNESILPHLSNVDLFREKVWKSYFKEKESLYDELLKMYRRVKRRRQAIEQQARAERTQWERAIETFNERFFVPFKLAARNKAAVALGHEAILDLEYTFHDGNDEATVDRENLLTCLSQGEKKALYILNIIFEIEVRRTSQQETLFVVDDIADSFDYKNKYAIIQYLQEISEGPQFKLMLLTHNFDFFRTVESRFVGYGNCLMATKTNTETRLSQALHIRNPFLKSWKQHLFDDGKKRVASISFARNLIEHTRGEDNAHYSSLTSLLHWKGDTASITQTDLDNIFSEVFEMTGSFGEPTEPVIDLITNEANACLVANVGVDLESKVVLSIAIRLLAEKFMVTKINDTSFVSGIERNQTFRLVKRFETDFSNEIGTIAVLRRVVLMTPKNIHLNAFMYEPILDMSDDALRALYTEVSNLH